MRSIVLVALVAACGDRTGTSTSEGSAVGSASSQRLLRYEPANMARYRVDVRIKTPPGAAIPIDIQRDVEIDVTGDERFLRARIAADDPLAAYDLGDAMDAVVLLFPELPKDPVPAMTMWNVARGIRVPGREQAVDIAHVVAYRDIPCSSGNTTCVMLYVEADARNTSVRVDNTTWLVVYSFWGKTVLDPQRGIVERAELHVTANVANGPANVTVNATAIATPSGPRD
jgi:hypothetical protein